MTTPLTDALVDAGIVTPHQIEAAWGAHDRAGGRLLLHLVLLGAIDSDALADFGANELALPRLVDGEIERVTRRMFEALPFDLAYEAGLVPLGYTDTSRLRVAAFDPSDARALEDAQFHVGVPLDVSVASALQVALAFERSGTRPWKVSSDEIRALRRGLGAGRARLESELKSLFKTGQLEPPPLESLDEPISLASLGGPPAYLDDEVIDLLPGQRVRVELVDHADGEIVELAPSGAQRRTEAPVRARPATELPPTVTTLRAVRDAPSASTPRADAPPEPDVTNMMFDSWGHRNPAPALPVSSSGRSVAAPPSVELGDRSAYPFAESTSAALSGDGARSASSSVSQLRFAAVTGGRAEAAPPSGPVRSTSVDAAVVLESGSRAAARLPSVGELLEPGFDGTFSPLDRLGDVAESSATRAAFELAVSSVLPTVDRDAVARQICESLSLVFPNILLLAPREGRYQVWDAALTSGDAASVGLVVDILDGDVVTRVATEVTVFRGTLPVDEPLRRKLPRAFGRTTLIAPLTIAGKTVALLGAGSGMSTTLAAVGPGLVRLQEATDGVFRAIIARKKSARSR